MNHTGPFVDKDIVKSIATPKYPIFAAAILKNGILRPESSFFSKLTIGIDSAPQKTPSWTSYKLLVREKNLGFFRSGPPGTPQLWSSPQDFPQGIGIELILWCY